MPRKTKKESVKEVADNSKRNVNSSVVKALAGSFCFKIFIACFCACVIKDVTHFFISRCFDIPIRQEQNKDQYGVSPPESVRSEWHYVGDAFDSAASEIVDGRLRGIEDSFPFIVARITPYITYNEWRDYLNKLGRRIRTDVDDGKDLVGIYRRVSRTLSVWEDDFGFREKWEYRSNNNDIQGTEAIQKVPEKKQVGRNEPESESEEEDVILDSVGGDNNSGDGERSKDVVDINEPIPPELGVKKDSDNSVKKNSGTVYSYGSCPSGMCPTYRRVQ